MGSVSPAGILAPAVIVLSTWFLYALIWEQGLDFSWKDPSHYLNAAFNLSQGRGLVVSQPENALYDGSIVDRQLVTFPPLTSLAYAALMVVGVPPDRAPTVLALIMWPVFLAGIGLLARRLGATAGLATVCIALSAVTWPYLSSFVIAQSEVLFLPMLVFSMVLLIDLPERDRGLSSRLWLSALLFSLILLSRYIAMVMFGAVLLWWICWRLSQRRALRLAGELAVFLLAAAPLAIWILTREIPGHPFSGLYGVYLHTPRFSTVDVLRRMAAHLTWWVLPAVRPGAVWRSFGVAAMLPVLALLAGGIVLGWRRRPRWRPGLLLPRTPIPFLIAAYFGVFLVLRSTAMNWRYMAAALCIGVPLLVGAVGRVAPRGGHLLFGGQLALNVGLLAALCVASGPWVGAEVRDSRPAGFADRPVEAWRALNAGLPSWLVRRPPRLLDLANHHPEVASFVDGLGERIGVVSNAPELFTYRPFLPGKAPLEGWLARGTCRPSRGPLVLVVVDWDRWRLSRDWPEAMRAWIRAWGWWGTPPSELRRAIEERCPGLEEVHLGSATVYLLQPNQ